MIFNFLYPSKGASMICLDVTECHFLEPSITTKLPNCAYAQAIRVLRYLQRQHLHAVKQDISHNSTYGGYQGGVAELFQEY